MELRQLKSAVAVRGPHHRDVDSHAVEPVDTVHPTSLDRRLALQLHTKFNKERLSSLKVIDDDAHVVHPLDRHGGSPSMSRGLSWPPVYQVPGRRHILDTRKRAEFQGTAYGRRSRGAPTPHAAAALLILRATPYPSPRCKCSPRHRTLADDDQRN